MNGEVNCGGWRVAAWRVRQRGVAAFYSESLPLLPPQRAKSGLAGDPDVACRLASTNHSGRPLRSGRLQAASHRCALLVVALVCALAGMLFGCRQDMQNQPRYRPLRSAYDEFADGRSERPLLPGTVARGLLRDDELFYTGMMNGQPAAVFPFPISEAVIRRGEERYNIFCAPCHSRLGDGNGMVARRGFRHPPSFHTQALRQAPAGHFFDVITNGFGSMPDYASQIPPRDRWAIVAYVRALQFSENATLADVPIEQRAQLTTLRRLPGAVPGRAGAQQVGIPVEPGHAPGPPGQKPK